MTRVLLVACLSGLFPALAVAQQGQDSLPAQRLRALVVTAERVSAPVNTAVQAVSRITRAELRTRAVRTLAEAIQQVPGVAFVDFDGSGTDAQAMVRGFYGGGEADYMLLLVDGRPLNAIETGRINWDLLPVSAIEAIEVVRGASSAAWGDAALGGVINVITRQPAQGLWRSSVRAGTHGVARAAVSGAGRVAAVPFSGYLDLGRSAGFREHAERSTGTVGITLGDLRTERGYSLTALSDWRAFDEPGALTGTELGESRNASSLFHRFDRVDERMHRVTLERRAQLAGGRWLSSLTGELRHGDRIRTLRLSPDFADTKNRELSTRRLAGSSQLEVAGLLTGGDALLVGVEGSYGRIASDYYDYVTGPGPAYQAPAQRGALSASTTGQRSMAAGFARYAWQAAPALQLTLSGRADFLHDTFETDAPDSSPDPETHLVLSPRVGANIRYLQTDRQSGHAYLTVGRSFKAPTPDQLYDRRLIPVPFPPFQITFANPDLKPQQGTSYEAGLYHETELDPAFLALDLSLALYQIDLRDEIDFDINTFGYRNLGRSRHRGLEAGLNLRGPRTVSVFTNYTLQAATAQFGENDGKYLKAIPRHFLVAGVSAGAQLSGALSATHAQRSFLDDANEATLPDWTRWDLRLAYRWRDLVLSVDAFNLLDRRYNSTGYPDAASTEIYYYPAARRTLQIGLSWGG